MTAADTTTGVTPSKPLFQDVLIVGAGLSGINMAYRIAEANPDISYRVLERRENAGGTWDLFRYPGVRSDSDIFSLSYPFLPWKGLNTIATGTEIRDYINEAIRTFGIDKNLTFGVHVTATNFDSTTDLWTVTATVGGETVTYQSRYIALCTGYYNYDTPYSPEFAGLKDFGGQVVHPQFWPEDLDYKNKNVVVIGSGATAITLIPSMAPDAAKVTMLQRSPTYIMAIPDKDPLTKVADVLLPKKAATSVTRMRNILLNLGFYQFCRRAPKTARKVIRRVNKAMLPAGYPVDVHFNPKYNPWDQRLCVVPNGDLFKAIRKGKAEIVTSTIDHFDATGVALANGQHLDADIVVTATGLEILALGGVAVTVDGAEVKFGDRFLYKGFMLEGVPNLCWTVGYTNASWTLRADITAQSTAELLKMMRERGFTRATADSGGAVLNERPTFDLASSYVQRAEATIPKASDHSPWAVRQNFFLDSLEYRRRDIDEALVFSTVSV